MKNTTHQAGAACDIYAAVEGSRQQMATLYVPMQEWAKDSLWGASSLPRDFMWPAAGPSALSSPGMGGGSQHGVCSWSCHHRACSRAGAAQQPDSLPGCCCQSDPHPTTWGAVWRGHTGRVSMKTALEPQQAEWASARWMGWGHGQSGSSIQE